MSWCRKAGHIYTGLDQHFLGDATAYTRSPSICSMASSKGSIRRDTSWSKFSISPPKNSK